MLVKGAVIQCIHGGHFQLTKGDARLTVDGNGAVLSGMEAGLTFGTPAAPLGGLSPCTAQTPPPASSFVPCVTGPATPPGMARKLAVGGTPVLLDTATGTTVSGTGPGTWSVAVAGQTKLESS